MDIEPLPKVTFLPAQLTELVIKNWTGDVIDYEKNGQVSFHFSLIFIRSAKCIMGKEPASSVMDILTRENSSMACSTERDSSLGLMLPYTRENSQPTR